MIKSWLQKAKKLRKEARELEKKAKNQCSHPIDKQYAKEHILSGVMDAGYIEDWFYCGVCDSKLREETR